MLDLMRSLSILFAGTAIVSSAACSSTTRGTCGPDDYESNDTPETARALGEMTDDPDSKKDLSLTVTSAQDEDFFRFNVFDRGLGGDPVVRVAAPPGFTVTTWFACASGAASVVCTQGGRGEPYGGVAGCASLAPSSTVESTTDCSGTSDDDGIVLVRVRRAESATRCEAYRLQIRVE